MKQYYAFVESRDFGQAPSLTQLSNHIDDMKDFNVEIILSIVDKKHFDKIEDKFGECDKGLKEDRDNRKININKYFEPKDYTGMVNLWCNIGVGDGVHFREILQPGNWYMVSFDFKGKKGFPVIVIKTEEIIEDEAELTFLNSISSIPEYTYNRLLEIFSLKHIQALQLEDDNRAPNENNPTPPPELIDAISLPEDDELIVDEFGVFGDYINYNSLYSSITKKETIFWEYKQKNETALAFSETDQ